MLNWIKLPYKEYYLSEKLTRLCGLFPGVQCIGNHQGKKVGRVLVKERL